MGPWIQCGIYYTTTMRFFKRILFKFIENCRDNVVNLSPCTNDKLGFNSFLLSIRDKIITWAGKRPIQTTKVRSNSCKPTNWVTFASNYFHETLYESITWPREAEKSFCWGSRLEDISPETISKPVVRIGLKIKKIDWLRISRQASGTFQWQFLSLFGSHPAHIVFEMIVKNTIISLTKFSLNGVAEVSSKGYTSRVEFVQFDQNWSMKHTWYNCSLFPLETKDWIKKTNGVDQNLRVVDGRIDKH